METANETIAATAKRQPWNKGRLVGPKPPLQPKHVWAIRTRLQIAGRTRDLALFNLAIDSKLRGCDVVSLKVEDVAPHGYAVDCATVLRNKTGRPVRFEITEQTISSSLAAAARSALCPRASMPESYPSGSTASVSIHQRSAPTRCGGPRRR